MATDVLDVNLEYQPLKSMADFRSKRTKAMPKNSLFGSTMEMHDEDELAQIGKIHPMKYFELKELEREERGKRYKPSTLPKYLQQRLPGNELLQHSKETLEQQIVQSKRAQEHLRDLQARRKYFQDVNTNNNVDQVSMSRSHSHDGTKTKKPQWLTEDDLKHAAEINDIGLGEQGNYNHQKYGVKNPTHSYNLIGGPLEMGMDFPGRTLMPMPPGPPVVPNRHPQHANVRAERNAFMWDKAPRQDLPKFAIELPPNIQHKFGTKVCSAVLSDPEKVNKALEDQKRSNASFLRSRSELPRGKEPAVVDDECDPVYESLGNALRQNTFPGYISNHKKSLNSTVYTDDVWRNRVPVPDKWRYQRDWLSTWAEQDVIREKIKKSYDVYLDDILRKKAPKE